MDVSAADDLVQHIHDSPTRIVLAVTGGGSSAISQLLTVPGASRTVLEAIVPYADQAIVKFLGGPPDRMCSSRTARSLAMAAWQRAICCGAGSDERSDAAVAHLAGVGCTAALTTDRPRRGSHRVHVAVQTATATWTVSVELTKGRRTRAEEEHLVTGLLLNQVAAACGLSEQLPLELNGVESVRTLHTQARPDWTDLLLGRVDATCEGAAMPGSGTGDEYSSGLVFPGAFHPLHEGHQRMAEVARAKLGRPVEFELSLENVDKPPLDFTEIACRLDQFTPTQPVWLTRAPTFLAKSQLFPGATFVVGADTIVRLADPTYYGGSQAACRAAIAEIARRDCRFLVFGRLLHDRFCSAGDLELFSELRLLCKEVPEEEYRLDISSTQLRQMRAGGPNDQPGTG